MSPAARLASGIAIIIGLLSTPALADDTDAAALAAARDFVTVAMPGQCDEMGGDPSYPDEAIPLSWKPSWGGEDAPTEHATLYRIFCGAGAYNTIHAFAMKAEDGSFSLVTFAQPTFSLEREEDDDSFTRLKRPPEVTGFTTAQTLVDAEYDSERDMITSYARWRGLGDAWSSGAWELRDGQFVLIYYEIDPIYEANLDNPSDDLHDQSFRLFSYP